jgi:hypothetical protein
MTDQPQYAHLKGDGQVKYGKLDVPTPGTPKYPWGKWPKINPETVAPLRDGKPDMYNHRPTRFVSKDEAKARGWKHFWTGEICVTGHRAARYVANTSICVDCYRIEQGKLPVYGKGVPELEEARKRNYTQKNTPAVVGPAQPSAAEKLFLTKYAEHKDFTLAAEACGRTESEFLAILSWNVTFREAVNRLEESIGIARTQQVSEYFDWTDDKRRSFLITYANTADMKQALRSVGATNVQFHKELADNADFQRDFDDATQISRSVFDHAASAAAAKGDMRMLGRVASNLFPEKFGENLKMDLKVTQNLSLDQAHAQITNLLSRFDRQGLLPAADAADDTAEEAEYQLIEPAGIDETDPDPEPASADAGSDPNSDLVSGSD